MVVVCGEALVDRIHRMDRTNDAVGGRREVLGGGPFNTARALARLGVPVTFLGRVSRDRRGRRLRQALVAAGVDVTMTSTGDEPSPVAYVELDAAGRARYRFALAGSAAAALEPSVAGARFGPGVAALHVGSLCLAVEPSGSTIAGLVRRERRRRAVVVDPNVRPGVAAEEAYRERLLSVAEQATIVKASDADLEFMMPGLAPAVAAAQLLARGPRLVVVTLGERGAIALHGRALVEVRAPRVEVVDTVGAGDVFGAALVAWLHGHGRLQPDLVLAEDALREAVHHACVAASLTCERAGADPPTAAELVAATERLGRRPPARG